MKTNNKIWKRTFQTGLLATALLLTVSQKLKAQTNTSYGIDALKSVTTGYDNSAFGYQALYQNTTGISNTASGLRALYSNTTGWSNTANGATALQSNTTGGSNTATGVNALYSNTDGNNNTANGAGALQSNTIGWSNTANGATALQSNTTGGSNTATGVNALYSNTTGYYNTANGYQALHSNTTGYGNTATGMIALFSNTGSLNTASGYQALYYNTTGYNNTASGFGALQNNTVGNNNTALGWLADVSKGNLTNTTAIGANAKVIASNTIQLGDNAVTKVYAGVGNTTTLIAGGLQITGGTPAAGKVLTSDANGVATWQTPMGGGGGSGWGLTGTAGTVDGTNFIGTTDNIPFNIKVNNEKAGRIDVNNAFYGYQSGNARTTGGFNTANGYQALYANTTGDGNTAVGDRSLRANTTGNYNTAIGSLTLNSNIDGKYNTAIGYNALSRNITGINNTAIGYLTGPNADPYSNTTAIGYNSSTTANNQIRIGNSVITSIGGQVDWTALSDSRVKKDIQTSLPGLAFITKLRPITYHLNMDAIARFLKTPDSLRLKDAEAIKGMELQTGFLAQEVEKAAQELNFEFSGVDKPKNKNDLYGLRYAAFTVPLVKAVQEQQTQIEQLQKEKEQQQKINEQLQQQIDELKKLITGNNNLSKEPVNKITTSSEAEGFKLFPNPTTGVFTITANNINNATIEVYDMLGNSVKKEMPANIKSGYQLDLSGHAKGTYWVNIISGNKKYTKQIVVQ